MPMLKTWMIPLAVLFGSGAAHAAELDQWCATEATRPSSIVICADPELRSLAVLRTKLLNDARAYLHHNKYQALQDDQNRWIKSYTGNCGVSINGPPVTTPIPPGVIDCYKEAGRQRVAYLIDYLTQQVPGYRAPQLPGTSIADTRQAAIEQNRETEAAALAAEAQEADQAAKAKAEQESQQAALAAEHAREELRAQAVAERGQKITGKLKELGFQVISPIDLELDWRDLIKNGAKVALWGNYARVDDVDALLVDHKDQPVIRLYTDGASRDARKAMLECRDASATACRMVIGGTVRSCFVNRGQINERELPCLNTLEAYPLPEGWQPAAAEQK
jgi:hypothetical protein